MSAPDPSLRSTFSSRCGEKDSNGRRMHRRRCDVVMNWHCSAMLRKSTAFPRDSTFDRRYFGKVFSRRPANFAAINAIGIGSSNPSVETHRG